VTDEVRAREKLEAALSKARRYQTLFSLSNSLPAVLDTQLRFIDASPAWARLLGWSDDELLGAPLPDFVHPDDLGPALEVLKALSREDQARTFLLRFRACDGSYRWLSWSATLDPHSGHVLGLAHDITTLKATGERLRKSEEFLRQTGSLAHVGGWEIRPGEAPVWSNEACRIFEVPLSSRLSPGSWFFSEEGQATVQRAVDTCFKTGASFDLELPMVTASARRGWGAGARPGELAQ